MTDPSENTSSDTPTASPPSTDTPRRGKRGWKIVGGLLLLVGLLAFLAPTLLSSGWARNRVVETVNESAPGNLTIEDWSWGWSGPVRISGVSFLQENGMQANLDEITLESGLWTLLTRRQAGEVQVNRPIVDLPASMLFPQEAPNETPAPPPAGPEPSPNPGSPTTETPETTPELALPFGFRLAVRDGEVRIDGEPALTALTVDLPLESVDAPIVGKLTAQQPGGGQLLANFTADINHPAAATPLDAPVDATVELTALDLARLPEGLRRLPQLPHGQGLVDGSLVWQKPASGAPRLEARFSARDVDLTGGPLTEDRLQLPTAQLKVEALLADPPQLLVAEVELPFARLDASGSAESLETSGKIELAGLAAALPRTLGLQEGLTVDAGTLRFRATASDLLHKRRRLDATLRLDGLAGRRGEQALAMEQPIVLSVDGAFAGREFDIERLQGNASFLTLSGKGTHEDFSAEASMDLTRALQDLGAFIDLKGWDASGGIRLQARIQPADAGTTLSATLDFDQLSVAENGLPLITEQDIHWNIQGAGDPAKGRFDRLDIAHQSALATGRASVMGLQLADEDNALPGIESIKAGGRYDLAKLVPFLHHLGGVPPEVGLDGWLNLTLKAAMQAGTVNVSTLQLELEELVVETPDMRLRDPRAVIQSTGPITLVPDEGRLSPMGLTASGQFGTLTLREVSHADWRKGLEGLSAGLQVDLDLGALQQSVALKNAPTPAPEWTGHARVEASFRGTSNENWQASFSASARDWIRKLGDKVVLNEPAMALSGEVQQTPEGLAIQGLTLDSTMLDLSANATLFKGSDAASNRFTRARMQGEWTPDLAAIGTWLSASTGQELELAGKRTEAFRLDLPLPEPGQASGGVWGMLREADLAARIGADRIAYLGLVAEDLQIPISISNQVAQAAITARVNGGSVTATPSIDLTPTLTNRSPELVLPADQRVLDGVQLTDELADALLASINPIFKGASVATGTVSLVVSEFTLPLEETWQPRTTFTGQVELQNVELAASGLATELLDAVKVRERTVRIGTRTLGFQARNGRIHADPLEFKVQDQALRLAGSVGFDQTLRYEAEVPLAKELVGAEVAKYTQGQTLRLPIGGTLTHPRLDPSALRAAVANAAAQAATARLTEKLGDKLGIGPGDDPEKPKKPEDVLREKAEEKINDALDKLFR